MSPYSNLTDSELLLALREGHEKAFSEIYDRYVQKLYGYAKARVRDSEECKDIVQETFEALIKSKAKVRELRPFLFTALKFRVIKYYEHQAVEKRFSTYMAMFKEKLLHNDEIEPEIETLRGMINQSLLTLPQRYQDAVKMRIDENLSLDDIAERMHVNRTSVIQYLSTALSHVKKEHSPIYKTK